MKTFCIQLLTGLMTVSVCAQGTIQFLNTALSRLKYQDVVGGPIVDTTAPAGLRVGVVWGDDAGGAAAITGKGTGTLVLPTAVTTTGGLWNGGTLYPIPGTEEGQRIWLKIVGWAGGSATDYSTATHYGESDVVSVVLGPTVFGPGTVVWQSAGGTLPDKAKPFVIAPTFLLQINTVGGGSVWKRANETYPPNATARITAVPAVGWGFSHWSGDASGTGNPLSVTMTMPKSITAHFTATAVACAVPAAGLMSWWPGASNAVDIIGTNNGTLQNGATFASGKVGTGFHFDGVNDQVQAVNSATLNFSSTLTIEAWIKSASTPNFSGLVNKFWDSSVGGDNSGYYLGFNTGGTLRCGVGIGGGLALAVSHSKVVTDGQWHHVAAVLSSSQVILYVDGVAGLGVAPVGFAATNAQPLYLGRDPAFANRFFNGAMDEVAIYNRALSASEMQAIYNAGSLGKCMTPLYIGDVHKEGPNLNLIWLAQPDLRYRVQYRTNFNAATPWLNVSGDVTATHSLAGKTDVVPTSAPQRFYRVELLR